MTEYLIAFNDEWVPDHTVEELREKSKAVRALVAEMKAAGVFIFTGGLDDAAPVFSVDASSGTPLFTDGPFIESKEHLGGFAVVDVADEEAARLWPAVGRRRCDASRSPCNFRRLLNGVGGRSCREAGATCRSAPPARSQDACAWRRSCPRSPASPAASRAGYHTWRRNQSAGRCQSSPPGS
jgi:hypothetical protein